MRSASEKAAAVSALRNDVKQMEQRAGAKKDFETKQSSVFATPGSPLAHFLTAESGSVIRLGYRYGPSIRPIIQTVSQKIVDLTKI
jgi:hypothetical protein